MYKIKVSAYVLSLENWVRNRRLTTIYKSHPPFLAQAQFYCTYQTKRKKPMRRRMEKGDSVHDGTKKRKMDIDEASDGEDVKDFKVGDENCSQRTDKDMFEDNEDESEDNIVEYVSNGSKRIEECEQSWKGEPLTGLRSELFPNPPKPQDRNWTVLVRLSPVAKASYKPFPEKLRDMWDEHHVRMPFSDESLFPFPCERGKKELKKRWDLIKSALSATFTRPEHIEHAILLYNKAGRWSFEGLHNFFKDDVSEVEMDLFFERILPSIVKLCLDGPKLVTSPVPLLKRKSNQSLTFSQSQIASLLANAFFCTYPRRNATGRRTEYSEYPDINFNRLFSDLQAPNQSEKLKCIVNYFRRMATKLPCEESLVTFRRRCVDYERLPKWHKSKKPLPRLHIDSRGRIEDEGKGMLQVDFANAFVGGGVLGHGCVQEEIRFLLSPELILSRLFTERLSDNEALIITGFERFSDYEGYASSFRFGGDHVDATPVDSASQHRRSRLVAIDALMFGRNTKEQYTNRNIVRELNKAYVGYQNENEGIPVAVATGNWGCGAFGGDPLLKSLLQLMAAAEAGRDVAYFTFGDERLRDDIYGMHQFLQMRGKRVGEMFELICSYEQNRNPDFSLHDHIYNVLSAYDVDTDTDMNEADANGETAAPNCDSNKDEGSEEASSTQTQAAPASSVARQSLITQHFKAAETPMK